MFSCLAIPENRSCLVLRRSLAMKQHASQIKLPEGGTLFCGFAVPQASWDVVLFNTHAVVETPAQSVQRFSMSLVSGLPVVSKSLLRIFDCSFARDERRCRSSIQTRPLPPERRRLCRRRRPGVRVLSKSSRPRRNCFAMLYQHANRLHMCRAVMVESTSATHFQTQTALVVLC